MGSSVPPAQRHLRLLISDQRDGRRGEPCGPEVVHVALGPGEWALMLTGGGDSRPAPLAVRDLLNRVMAAQQRPAGRRFLVERAEPAALGGWAGPAVLHHTSAETVMYCRADHITAQAADSLAALGARALEVLRPARAPGESYKLSVVRASHGDLSADLHPAVATVRGLAITVHVCSRVVTHELADAMGTLYTACAERVTYASAGVRPPVLRAGLSDRS
jgi:hypothetical protein